MWTQSKQELAAAIATLTGMAVWGWVASRRARIIAEDLSEVALTLRNERAAARIIARAGFEEASKAPMDRPNLRAVN